MILEQNELEIAKELYEKAVELYRQRVELEVLKKERAENLQAEIAQICEIKNATCYGNSGRTFYGKDKRQRS